MKNHKSISLIGILLTFCLSCTDQIQKDSSQSKEVNESVNSSISKEKTTTDKWVYYYNLKSDSIKFLYDSSSVKILENEAIINGREQIGDYILSNSSKVISIKSDTVIVAHKEKAIEYEISETLYEGDERYKNLVIWQTRNYEKKRVFEFSAKTEDSEPDLREIDKRRELWIDFCNKHDAKKLIREMYTENTLYFNHKPIVKGREQLLEEYQYMNRESYKLSLQPEITVPVNQELIFEIGQCSGNYKGKYILIWRKDSDGKWRIFIDSNI